MQDRLGPWCIAGEQRRAFADRYRLRGQFSGLGYGPAGRYEIGRVSHAAASPLAPALSDEIFPAHVDTWQWSGEGVSLWETATIITAMNAGRGLIAPDVVEPAHYLPHLYRTTRGLVGRSAYLDDALPG